MTDPTLSYAVILTRDAGRAAAALDSIAAQEPASELLLVLNDVDADMRALATAWAERGARVLHDGVDVGVTPAYNLALREARGAFLVTVHEDSELAPGCASRLLATAEAEPRAGVIGPQVTTPRTQFGDADVIWRDGATSAVTVAGPAPVIAVDYTGTSCMLLRRTAALSIGGFDTRYFPAIYSDVDLCLRLWAAGWAVLTDRRARYVHRTGAMVDASRGPPWARFRVFLLERNRVRFVARHAEWLAGLAERNDAGDARHPTPEEVAEVMRRSAERWAALTADPPTDPRALDLPDDLDAFAADARRAIEDEFLEHLVAREAELRAEADGLHRAYAELHTELERVHRAHAEYVAGVTAAGLEA